MRAETNNKPQQTEINTSWGNFFDKGMLYTVVWPVRTFVKKAEESGYKGVEFHSSHFISGVQAKTGLLNKYERDGIRSLHQSFREEKNIKESWNHPNRMLALQTFVAFPEQTASLKDLERIQKAVGRDLSIVLSTYSPEPMRANFKDKTIQPCPELMEQLDTKSPEELNEKMQNIGLSYCYDTYHARRKPEKEGETNLNPWQETLQKILPFVKKIHVSVGRTDIKQEQDFDTMEELNDLLYGTENTDLPAMLKTFREAGWSGEVVTEIPASSLREVTGKSGLKDYVENHKRVADRIHNLLHV